VIVEFVVAVVATAAFAVLFSAPPRHYPLCGLVGGLGWIVYSLMMHSGAPLALATVCAALMLTVVARLASVALRTPVTVFLLAGIFPLVPGAGIYYTAYHLFAGEGAMASAKGTETFIIAGAISLGILFGSALPQGMFVQLVGVFRKK